MKRLAGLIIVIVFILSGCVAKQIKVSPSNVIKYAMVGQVRSAPFIDMITDAAAIGVTKIIIEIQSPGGYVHEALRIIGVMDEYRNIINFETRIYGAAMSGGFIVFVAGDIGSRYIAKSALIMWHKTYSANSDKTASSIKSAKYITSLMNRYIISRSAIPIRKLIVKINNDDWYITPEEAIRYRFADGYIPNKVAAK